MTPHCQIRRESLQDPRPRPKTRLLLRTDNVFLGDLGVLVVKPSPLALPDQGEDAPRPEVGR